MSPVEILTRIKSHVTVEKNREDGPETWLRVTLEGKLEDDDVPSELARLQAGGLVKVTLQSEGE